MTPETRALVLAEVTTAAEKLAETGVRLRGIIARLESSDDPGEGDQGS